MVKEHSRTLVARPCFVMRRELILEVHLVHSFIINMQPNVPTATFRVRVKHVNCIVPTACELAVVVEHARKLLARWPREW